MPAPEHVHKGTRFDWGQVRTEMAELDSLNSRIAVLITGAVGTMWCAYGFAAIALLSLPAAIGSGQVIVIVAWIAQTFLQLVLLSIIMVGQRVQSAAADARSAKTFEDAEAILDRLDTRTQGGIQELDAKLAQLLAGQQKP